MPNKKEFETTEHFLSLEKSYTGGNKKVEIMDCTREDYLYLQLVDGCGYDVYLVAPEEALEIGKALVKAAEFKLNLRKK